MPQLFLSFEFRAKLFGQELLGFRQPNLIYCLSTGEVDKKFSYSVSCSLNCRFYPSINNFTVGSGLHMIRIFANMPQLHGWLIGQPQMLSLFNLHATAASVSSCRAQATIDPLKPRVSLLFLTMHLMEYGAFTACFTMLPSPSL